jgi:hypothetical protein
MNATVNDVAVVAASRETGQTDRSTQQRRDRRLGDEPHHQGGDRDAQLRTRQLRRQRLQRSHDTRGPPVTLLSPALDRRTVYGDQGELSGDEKRVGGDEQDDDTEQ